jgi:hypothetical protein
LWLQTSVADSSSKTEEINMIRDLLFMVILWASTYAVVAMSDRTPKVSPAFNIAANEMCGFNYIRKCGRAKFICSHSDLSKDEPPFFLCAMHGKEHLTYCLSEDPKLLSLK